jgi:hypothetical protein
MAVLDIMGRIVSPLMRCGQSVYCREWARYLPSISAECMASLAAAASLELSKVTKPKPRDRVGFSLGEQVALRRCGKWRALAVSPVHGDECVKHFAVPAEGIDEDVFVCAPRQVADVAAIERAVEDWREQTMLGGER